MTSSDVEETGKDMVVDQELPFLLHGVLTLVPEDVVLLSTNRCISSYLNFV